MAKAEITLAKSITGSIVAYSSIDAIARPTKLRWHGLIRSTLF